MVSVKFALRKSLRNCKRTLSLLPIIIVGTMFFVILFTIVRSYETSALKFFEDYHYADYTLYGEFDDRAVESVSNLGSVAEGRYSKDYKSENLTVRAVSKSREVNCLYLYEGSLQLGIDDCLLLERNAKALGLGIGDDFAFSGKSYRIVGLVASPEYVYLVKDEKSVMSQADKFVVVYLNKENFSNKFDEILIKSNSAFDEGELMKINGATLALSQKEQINYTLYQSDLDEISSFAYIFPILFLVITAVIIFVMLKRTISSERKTIATMKALGAGNGKITLIYLTQFILLQVLGVIIGCFAAMLMTNFIISLFSAMFVVPYLKFTFYPLIWLTALLIMTAVTLLSGVISLIGVFKLEPAEAMRPVSVAKDKRILLEKTRIWKKLSFNTRYALKNSMRNKGRFFASAAAMAFSLALLILSSGFMDSISGTKNAFFSESAQYDLIVTSNFMPYATDDPVIAHCSDYAKALEFTAKINGDQVPVKIVDKDFTMVNLPQSVEEGIVVPSYYAQKWKMKKGDTISFNNKSYKIGDIQQQYIGLSVYASYEYMKKSDTDFAPFYNCVYIKGESQTLMQYLLDNNRFYTSIKDDASVFENVSGSVKILTSLMILCAVVLGIFALYSIGLINLSSREQEYAQLIALGYSDGKIVLAQLKETILQFLLALPIGLLGGNLFLLFIKGEFSNQSFCLKPTVYFPTYLFSIITVIALLALITWIALRQIQKIDIVEKCKIID